MATKKTTKKPETAEVEPVKKERPLRGRGGTANFPSVISGAKSEATLPPETVEAVRRQLLEQEAGALVAALRQAGLDKAAALALLDRLWNETEKEEGT